MGNLTLSMYYITYFFCYISNFPPVQHESAQESHSFPIGGNRKFLSQVSDMSIKYQIKLFFPFSVTAANFANQCKRFLSPSALTIFHFIFVPKVICFVT